MAFAARHGDAVGGLFFASMFFSFAAFLGADFTTGPNKSSKAKLFFKGLAILFSLPVLALGFLSFVVSVARADWLNAVVTAGQVSVLALALVGIAFENRPVIKRTLKRFGFAVAQEKKSEK